MKEPKKTAWEESVKPEPLSLRMVGDNGVMTDQELVEEAEKHLLKLLRSPYYYEAYQRLHKKLPGRRPGQLPVKGAKARELQTPEPKPNRHTHRPRKDLLDLIARREDNYRLMLAQVNALIGATTGESKKKLMQAAVQMKKDRIDICRDLVDSHRELIQGEWPNIMDREDLIQKLYKAVGNYICRR